MRESTKIIKVIEFKRLLKNKLSAISENLNSADRMQIAINLKIEWITVKRYMDGRIEDVRRVELAEKILEEAEKIVKSKSVTNIPVSKKA